MEGNNFALPASHMVVTILIFTLLTISSASASCDSSTISSNSTQIYNEKTTYHSNSTETFRTYIKSSCNSATYPSICYKSLSPYASKIEGNPVKLSNFSLSLALNAARGASSTISEILKSNNLTGIAKQIVEDCFGDVKDSIGELQDSLYAMGHLNGTDRKFQISNIKTWVSAAITNDQTCSDGFDDGEVDPAVRDKIRNIILYVARMTSNALYMFNNFIY